MNRAPLWESGYNTSALLYQHISTLVKARQHFIKTSDAYTSQSTDVIYQDYHTFAMRKGVDGSQVITVVTNNGAATDNFKLHIKGHGFASGTEVSELIWSLRRVLSANEQDQHTVAMFNFLHGMLSSYMCRLD